MLGHVSISLRQQRNVEATNSILTYFNMLKEMLAKISSFWSRCDNLIEILFHFSLFSPHQHELDLSKQNGSPTVYPMIQSLTDLMNNLVSALRNNFCSKKKIPNFGLV